MESLWSNLTTSSGTQPRDPPRKHILNLCCSDCFAVLAFSWYFKATGCEKSRDQSLKSWENVERRRTNPSGKYNKVQLAFHVILF